MALSNIEKFDDIVGRAFVLLYESFPLTIPLNAGKFLPEHQLKMPDELHGECITPEAEFVVASLVWLRDAGYISARHSHEFGLSDVVLTAKGLEALKLMPDSLQASLGERLIAAAKDDGREVFRSVVGQVLSLGLQVLTSR